MQLELALVEPGPFRPGQEVRLRATYRADAPTATFHRMVMGWAPDELELLVDGPGGHRVSPRLLVTTPKDLPVGPDDVVQVTPEGPCTFDFPLWGDEPLPPGEHTVRARRPALTWLEGVPGLPAGLDRAELVSDAVVVRVDA